jgi:alkanesulfonate monooxygenase SsuD/methylene tetrahydromethanopterin reductase-like flavin-dependent oxidoreductase (luciferase family)
VLVTANVHRHPAVLANIIATTDVISGGRLEIGLGAGWNASELDPYGIPLHGVRERLERMDEAARSCGCCSRRRRRRTTGSTTGWSTPAASPSRCSGRCRPSASEAAAEKRTLRTVARWADHWNYSGGEPDELRHKLGCCGGTATKSGATSARSSSRPRSA